MICMHYTKYYFVRLNISVRIDKFLDGLAWDWINEKLYWTDYCDDDIEVYDPITGYRTVLFNRNISEPRAIVVDPTTKYVS